MPIYTDRLLLRTFVDEDFQMLRELDGDPVVLRYRSRKLISPEMTREFMDRARQSMQDRPRMYYAYMVVRRDGLERLGQCGLTVLTSEAREAFAWYSLLPRFWGQGYMSEAVRALVYAGATEFDLPRIFAESDPNNVASVRVMARAGLQLEGRVHLPRTGGGTEERIRYGLEGSELKQFRGPGVRIEPPL